MKKLILFFLLILSFTVFTANLQLHNPIIQNTSPYLETQDINFSLDITESDGYDVNAFILSFYIDEQLKSSNTYSIDGNSTKTFSFLYEASMTGDHNAFFEADLGIDSDITDNNSELLFHINKGINIRTENIMLSKTNVEEGEMITVTGYYSNIGDLPTGDFNSCFVHDSNYFYCWEDNLQAGEVRINSSIFKILNNDGKIKMILDIDNNISEYTEADNQMERSFSISTIPDLFVNGSLINIEGEAMVGEDLNIVVRFQNIGGMDVQSVIARIYHTSVLPQNLLAADTVYLGKGSDIIMKAKHIPYFAGSDIIIATIDAENTVYEEDESNNYAEKSYIINPEEEESTGSSYTHYFEIRDDCQALLSTGDRIIASDFDSNGVRFKIINKDADIIMDAKIKNGDEFIRPGRTIRVISQSKTLARIVIVYQEQFEFIYNECNIHIDSVVQELETLRKTKEDLQTALRREEAKSELCKAGIVDDADRYNDCTKDKSSLSFDYDICVTKKSEKSEELLQLKATISNKDNECGEKMRGQTISCKTEKDVIREEFIEKVDQSNFFSIAGWFLFFATAIIFLIQYRKNRLGGYNG